MSNRVLFRISSSPATRSRWLRYSVLFVLLLFLIFLLFSGKLLVSDQKEIHCQWGLVLDGQTPFLHRSDAALQLQREGWIDSIALSGTPLYRNLYTSQFAREDLLKQGGDPRRIFELRHVARSTWEEATMVIPFFREKGVDTVLLITSSYHTARAARIFNALSDNSPYFAPINIQDNLFRPWGWWNDREAIAIWFMEWSKTVATYGELLLKNRELEEKGYLLFPHPPEISEIVEPQPPLLDEEIEESLSSEKEKGEATLPLPEE